MLMYGNMNTINLPYDGAEYGLHVFQDPGLVLFPTSHALELSIMQIMETQAKTISLLDNH